MKLLKDKVILRVKGGKTYIYNVKKENLIATPLGFSLSLYNCYLGIEKGYLISSKELCVQPLSTSTIIKYVLVYYIFSFFVSLFFFKLVPTLKKRFGF